ncbi:hypothetical protein OG953_09170 [Streptomyces sp. NBC_00057]
MYTSGSTGRPKGVAVRRSPSPNSRPRATASRTRFTGSVRNSFSASVPSRRRSPGRRPLRAAR